MRPRTLRFFGRVVALALFAGAGVAAPRSAFAETSASEKKLAKEMLTEAIADEKAGKCVEALEVLRQVVQIQETGEALLHLGECLTKTSKLAEALKTWEHAEDVARGEKDKATQQALLPRLAALRSRIPAVVLQVPSDVKAVTIKVDGQPVTLARASSPMSLDPGDHTIDAQAEGCTPFTRKITLAEKESKVIVVELPSTSAPSGGGASSGAGVPLGTWIAGGVGVAFAVGGIVAFASAGSAAGDGAADCAKKVSCDAAAVKTVQRLDAAALGLWIGAGVSVGLGVTLFVLDKKGPAPGSSTSARRRPAPRASTRLVVSPLAIGLEGTF